MIFLSYANVETTNELVYDISNWLHGVDIRNFIDKKNIRGGDDFRVETKREIEDCDIFLACLCSGFLGSPHCLRELRYALECGKRIIPVLIQECNWKLWKDKYDFERNNFLPKPEPQEKKRPLDISSMPKAPVLTRLIRNLKDELNIIQITRAKTFAVGIDKAKKEAKKKNQFLQKYFQGYGIRPSDLSVLSVGDTSYPHYFSKEKILFFPISLAQEEEEINAIIAQLQSEVQPTDAAAVFCILYDEGDGHYSEEKKKKLIRTERRLRRSTDDLSVYIPRLDLILCMVHE